MITTILFDMDGVLIDAKEWHFLALNMALKEIGVKEIPIDDHIKIFDGLPTNKKLIKYQELYKINLSGQEDKINALKQKYTIKIAKENLDKDIQKIEMLKWLKSNNYKIGCCSNSIKDSVIFFLKKNGLLNFFDIVLSNNDVRLPKPNPEIYLSAMKKIHSSPRETLIFEDNKNGIEAARASGANLSIVKSPSDLTKEYVMNILNKEIYEKR